MEEKEVDHTGQRNRDFAKVHHVCECDDKDGLPCGSVQLPSTGYGQEQILFNQVLTFFSLFFLVFSGSLTSPMKGFARRGASLLGAGRCTPGRATLVRVLLAEKITEVDIAEAILDSYHDLLECVFRDRVLLGAAAQNLNEVELGQAISREAKGYPIEDAPKL